MDIKSNYPLSQITTFHIGGPALFYAKATNEAELKEALNFARSKDMPVLIIGGGSNLLVSDKGFDGLVIQIAVKGKEIVSESADEVLLKVGAGEIWDEVVAFSVEKSFWGIENLSYVPGRTGAVAVQNVGCYGQEASSVIAKLEVFDMKDEKIKELQNRELNFGYRKSRLNSESKNQFVILNVFLKLNKPPNPILNYVDLREYFQERGKVIVNLHEIRKALGFIRGWKFPKVTEMGNDGSCFKNLLLDQKEVEAMDANVRKNFSSDVYEKYEQIKHKFPTAGKVKMPSAFLVDICKLKGTRIGDAMLWDRQPLVIVNTTNRAKASDIAELFKLVRQTVYLKTGMILESEPEWVGFSQEELKKYFELL